MLSTPLSPHEPRHRPVVLTAQHWLDTLAVAHRERWHIGTLSSCLRLAAAGEAGIESKWTNRQFTIKMNALASAKLVDKTVEGTRNSPSQRITYRLSPVGQRLLEHLNPAQAATLRERLEFWLSPPTLALLPDACPKHLSLMAATAQFEASDSGWRPYGMQAEMPFCGTHMNFGAIWADLLRLRCVTPAPSLTGDAPNQPRYHLTATGRKLLGLRPSE